MKIYNYQVVMREFPDEITLALNITECPNKCDECHSPWLREDIGDELTRNSLLDLIDNNQGITCVGFMGGDGREDTLKDLAFTIRSNYPNLKIGWYSGSDSLRSDMIAYFDYIKFGHYDKLRGPLDSPTTNQTLLHISHRESLLKAHRDFRCDYIENITYKLQEHLAK